MDHRSITLIVFVIAFSLLSPFRSSAIHSPSPASSPIYSPPEHIISQTSGLVTHAPSISRRHHRKLSPPPLSSLRLRRPPASPPPPPPERLNLGKKLGLLFAAIVIVLQVTFAVFLIYKRWQLKKTGRRYRTRVSS